MNKKKNNYSAQENKLVLIFIMIMIIVITGSIFFLRQNNLRFKENIIQQWKLQIESTSRMTAMNIDAFISKFSKSLQTLADDPLLLEQIKKHLSGSVYDTSLCPLSKLFNVYQAEINALLMIDTCGRIIVKYPPSGMNNISFDTCFVGFDELKMDKSIRSSVSNVFVNRKNELSVTVSQSVYKDHELQAIIRWMITLKKIRNRYIHPFLADDHSYFWLLDENNVIIAHHDSSYLGLNANYILKDLQLTGKMAGYNMKKSLEYLNESEQFFNKINNQDDGFGNYIDFAHSEYCLAFFRKVPLQNRTWTIIMNVPYAFLLDPFYKHAMRSVLLAILFISISFLIIFIFFRITKSKMKLQREKDFLADLAQKEKELKEERQKHLTALMDGQEIERNRIAREIHDGLGQYLLALKLRIQNILGGIAAEENLKETNKILIKTLEETKRIGNNLLPLELEEMGLLPSLKQLINDFRESSAIQTDFVHYQVPYKLDHKTKTYIYRIIQEALTNVMKHAAASEVNVQILCNNEQLTLLLQDNGKGFITSNLKKFKGNGINNILNRVSILNGSCHFESSIKEGTLITIKIPVNENSI